MGQKVKLREDWEDKKLYIMYDLLMAKFSDPSLREKLCNTGDAELIEGNNWGDTFWGVCNGVGKNKLGEILMFIRKYPKNLL